MLEAADDELGHFAGDRPKRTKSTARNIRQA